MSLTQKQKELRATRIGSSEIGVLAGLSKWSTPIAIYESKVHGFEEEESLPMELGIEFEEPIARVYAKREQRFLVRVDSLANPKYPLAVASADRAVYANRAQWSKDARAKAGLEDLQTAEKLLECKSTSWRMAFEWGDPGTDQVPDYFLAQVTWQMGVTGVRASDIAVLVDKDRFFIYRLVFNQELFDGLYEIAGRFMKDHVHRKLPPSPDSSERYAEYLSRAFPRHNRDDDLIAASAEAERDVLMYAKLKLATKRIEAHQELVNNRIRAAIGNHAGLVSPRFGKLTWKKTRDGTEFDFESAFNDLQLVTGLLVSQLPSGETKLGLEKRLRDIAIEHSHAKPGYRRFHATFSNEAKLEIGQVSLLFDKLEAATLGPQPEADREPVKDPEEGAEEKPPFEE